MRQTQSKENTSGQSGELVKADHETPLIANPENSIESSNGTTPTAVPGKRRGYVKTAIIAGAGGSGIVLSTKVDWVAWDKLVREVLSTLLTQQGAPATLMALAIITLVVIIVWDKMNTLSEMRSRAERDAAERDKLLTIIEGQNGQGRQEPLVPKKASNVGRRSK